MKKNLYFKEIEVLKTEKDKLLKLIEDIQTKLEE